LSQPRRFSPLDLLHALGLSAMLFAASFGPLIFASGSRLHSAEPLTSVALANTFIIFLIAAVIAVFLAVLRMTRFWPACRLGLAIVLPVVLLERNVTFLPWTVHFKVVVLIGVAWCILVLLLRFFRPSWLSGGLQAGRIVLTGLGIFAVLALVQILRVTSWRPGPKETLASSDRVQPPSPANHPRLVWIVFDELSYDQLFEHRASDLSLPNFDALRSASSVYTQVQPAGFKTEKVLPSLLIGKTVTEISYTSSNQLRIRANGGRTWEPFDASQSLFAEAYRNGWHTGVVGWFIPYCPTFEQWVDRCYWEGWGLTNGPMSTYVGFRPNVAISLKVLAEKLVAPGKSVSDEVSFQVEQRLTSFQELEAHSIATLQSPDLDFVFLHLPLPHPPAIYDRHTGQFVRTAGYSYLDNLALTDRVLGNMLSILKASPRWSQTTLVINGDHGWRRPIWKADASWTAEDEEASRGTFDSRPALIIHRPGQTEAETVSQPLPLLDLHDMVGAMLRPPVNAATGAVAATTH
jgi:hypothetical protein